LFGHVALLLGNACSIHRACNRTFTAPDPENGYSYPARAFRNARRYDEWFVMSPRAAFRPRISAALTAALSARLHQARLTSRCNSGVDMQAIIPFCSHCKGLISYPEDEEHAFKPIKSSAV
jgi:hypothetical protein